MIRSLRLSLRFLLPLLLAILAVAYLSIPLVDSLHATLVCARSRHSLYPYRAVV